MPDSLTQGGAPAVPTQQPQAGIAVNTPPPATTAQATPPAGEPTTETMSLEEARKLRQEHNALRKRIADYEAQQKAADEAKLDELGKLQKAHADLTSTLTAAQQRAVRAEVKAAAVAAGIDPALAARLIAPSEVELDDAGEPKNLDKLLGHLVATYPYLANGGGAQAQPQQAGQQPGLPGGPLNPATGLRSVTVGGTAATGGATNPGRGATVAQPLTREAIQSMTRDEYLARRPEIQEFLARNAR